MSGVTASFDMADGSTLQGGAVAMQERYLQAVEQFVDEHPEVASSLPRTNVHDVLRQWRNTLEAFRSGNANALGTEWTGCASTACLKRYVPVPVRIFR